MLTAVINVAAAWLVYEIGVGVQVIRGEHFSYGKKHPYVPPTVLFSKDRQRYEDWSEQKGGGFK